MLEKITLWTTTLIMFWLGVGTFVIGLYFKFVYGIIMSESAFLLAIFFISLYYLLLSYISYVSITSESYLHDLLYIAGSIMSIILDSILVYKSFLYILAIDPAKIWNDLPDPLKEFFEFLFSCCGLKPGQGSTSSTCKGSGYCYQAIAKNMPRIFILFVILLLLMILMHAYCIFMIIPHTRAIRQKNREQSFEQTTIKSP